MLQHARKWIAMSVAFAVLQSSSWAAAVPRATSPERSVEQQVREIALGSNVEVRLAGQHRLKGRLGTLYENSFDLQVTAGGPIGARRIPFDDVQSVRMHALSTGKKVAIGLAIFGAVAALVAGLTLRAIARNG
jgi:hypothetical protein